MAMPGLHWSRVCHTPSAHPRRRPCLHAVGWPPPKPLHPAPSLLHSVVVVLAALLAQLWFGGSLPRGPYRTPAQGSRRVAPQ